MLAGTVARAGAPLSNRSRSRRRRHVRERNRHDRGDEPRNARWRYEKVATPAATSSLDTPRRT
jgi:hypothetical protein